MITCPNCNHQNPDGALQCEACYTPLPAMVACPDCGSTVQADASFCGQCGADLRNRSAVSSQAAPSPIASTEASAPSGLDSAMPTQNFVQPPTAASQSAADAASQREEFPESMPELVAPDPLVVPDPIPDPVASEPLGSAPQSPEVGVQPESPEGSLVGNEAAQSVAPPPSPEVPSQSASVPPPLSSPAATRLQVLRYRLRQVQTDTLIEIPEQLSVVRIGKPNDRTPPDIDVSGFPDSEVVSRVHANLLVEGDAYYIEDVGSSNGTYINGLPLPVGNRHRLRPGDRIALGKGDKVSFVFESA